MATPEEIYNLYVRAGSTVTGEDQTRLDDLYAQYQSGGLSSAAAAVEFGGSDGSTSVPDSASAKAILQAGLAQYGLEGVYDALWGKYTRGEIDPAMDPDQFIYTLREEPAYKQRFAANEIRKAKGMVELLPSTYLAMEQQYKNTMALNGLSQSYYSDQTKIDKLIGGDVAINELNNRLRDAYRVVRDAPADVTEKLKTMYGLTDGDILSYFLDPEQARKDMTSADYKIQAQAALTAAKAERQAGLQLGTPFAEKVARAGLTDTQTTNAFESIAGMRELGRAAQTEAGLSQEQVAGSALGLDTEAKKRLDELKRQKVAGLSGGGSFSQRQVSGSIRSSIGEA